MSWSDESNLTKILDEVLDQCSPPQVKSPFQGITAALHTAMIGMGFKLISFWRENQEGLDRKLGSTRRLPQDWNTSSSTLFMLRYSIVQDSEARNDYVRVKVIHVSKTEAFVTCTRDGTIVDAEEVDDESETAGFHFKYDQWLDTEEFPVTLPKKTISAGSSSYTKGFQNLSGLAETFRIELLSKVCRDLVLPKPSHPSSRTDDDQSDDEFYPVSRAAPWSLLVPPHSAPPRERPGEERTIPGFDDEFEILPKSNAQRSQPPPTSAPPTLGSQDLYPPGFGPNDPIRRIHDPYLRGDTGGGMHPTFDDPIFGPRGGRPEGNDGGIPGAFGAPPGSRFDPPGPFGRPSDNRPTRFPGGGSSNFPGGFGGGFV